MQYEKPTLEVVDLNIVETMSNGDVITGSNTPDIPWIPEPTSLDV